ncbi:hypothetical protein K1719_033560 [Acacia pycnantha]|nr:hypothetical protein K1719_033560 [Acacia pycnantha]
MPTPRMTLSYPPLPPPSSASCAATAVTLFLVLTKSLYVTLVAILVSLSLTETPLSPTLSYGQEIKDKKRRCGLMPNARQCY